MREQDTIVLTDSSEKWEMALVLFFFWLFKFFKLFFNFNFYFFLALVLNVLRRGNSEQTRYQGVQEEDE